MKLYNVVNLISRNSYVHNRLNFILRKTHVQYFNILRKIKTIPNKKFSEVTKNSMQKHLRKIHEITSSNDDLEDLELETEFTFENVDKSLEKDFAKNSLYNHTQDTLIENLKDCASVQDVLNVYNANSNVFSYKHAIQAILVLNDLQNIYQQVTDISSKKNFMNKLKEKGEFQQFLQLIEQNLQNLTNNEISFTLHYLTTLGLDLCDNLIQLLIARAKCNLSEDFSLTETARFFTTVFRDVSLKPFLIVQELVPFVIEKIENCPIEDFGHLSTCLNKIHRLVTNDVLWKYKNQVVSYMNDGLLTSENKATILKIISFLCLPQWRDECTKLISKCMLLLQGNLNRLDPEELVLLYDIFFKTKEPGDLLNEIQRCALTFLHKSEDDASYYTDLQLNLFLSLLCFLSPLQRIQYQKIARRYVFYSNEYNKAALLTLARILSYIRTSDDNLCEILWKNMVQQMRQADNELMIFKLCHHYVHFHADLNNFRYPQFERYCMSQLKHQFFDGIAQYIPGRVASILSFVLVYGKDKEFLETLITKLEENWQQLSSMHCLLLAQSIKTISSTPSRYFTRFELHRLNKTMDKVTEKELPHVRNCPKRSGLLLKSCILRKANLDSIMSIIDIISKAKVMSSRSVENISYCLMQSSILHQEVLDQCVDYMIDNKKHILGYEAERILFLCYNFGFHPKRIDEFIDVVINVVIRDQERLTGLTFLQTALALSFYGKLPQSFIKLIFNVEFLEKLDEELANCYSKDKYPQRVRNNLMQLNRSVCLQYPESNVPWFHEKYIEVARNQVIHDLEKQKMFPYRVKTYLSQLLPKPEYINEHVITPYGYHIDFEISLNRENKIVQPGSHEAKRKLAVILLQPKSFTKLCIQLKGKYQMMMKHLEILGYEVIFINFAEWINLVYAGERIDFLSNLIWPKRQNQADATIDR